MQLLYVANRYEKTPQICRHAADGTTIVCDRYLRVERRLRRSAGTRRRVADRDPAVPAAADLTILLDIAPETAVRRKASGPRSLRARPRAAVARARELSPPGGARRLARARRRASPREVTRRTSSPRSRHGSRGGKRPHFARPARSSTRAHASSVAPVVLTSSTRTTHSSAHVRSRVRRRRRRGRWRAAGRGRSACDGRVPRPPQRRGDRQARECRARSRA